MTEGIERVEGAFPIRETNRDTKMKNISPSALPHFHGLTTEDPDTFLFEFDVICQTYDYIDDEKKIKIVSIYPQGCNIALVHGFTWR